MDLSSLRPAKGAVKSKKRLGRGQGSGTGGTAGRGHKGAKSRSGYKSKIGFEGGQMPLQRRVPKRGFKNPNRIDYVVINLSQIQKLADKHNFTEFSLETINTLKLIAKGDRLKVLGNGELTSAMNIEAHAFSEKAKQAIENIGGKATTL
ncbi:MAG: 50S ribosomal protein L15 [Chitinophagales bacterium]|nr:50S ribosomal protein L15 [Chitinophagales bacterium]